jgi:FUS-interacting serine-arginine-rich protein 1
VLVSGEVHREPVKALPPPRPQVPAFTVGIKTLIFRNLPRDITVETLRRVVEKYGPVRDIYIPKNMDRASPYFGTIKGFALIKFLQPEDSARAYQEEYGRLTIGKNNITVEFAAADR